MGFIKAGTIVTDRVQIIPEASLYDFGVIISNVHMAWMRVTCMRLEMRYSYSKDIVYNNFRGVIPQKLNAQKLKRLRREYLMLVRCILIVVWQICMTKLLCL